MSEVNAGAANQAEHDNLFRDSADLSKAIRYVKDPYAQIVLNQILSALGGSSDTTPNVFNVSCPLADTEYNQALPLNTKSFMIKARKNSLIKFAYQSGATEWITINPGYAYNDDNFYSNKTIYFKNSIADEVVEVIAYT